MILLFPHHLVQNMTYIVNSHEAFGRKVAGRNSLGRQQRMKVYSPALQRQELTTVRQMGG